ncbi:MAG: tetratricopeptide repeat protein [Desulfobacterales bacterium]|nr:tetratricopeptide repeat protein [Desulfobacterales bacterium]
MNRAAALSISILLFVLIIFPPHAIGKSPLLREGIEQYKQENYEEAVDLLTKARKKAPKSSSAAFFLGMAYKQMMDYQKASKHLRDAVTLTPRIKEALVELIDVLYLWGKLDEAKKWIETAEKEEISPARIAFLKGLVLQKEGKNLEAIESFERAKSLDPKITQAVEVQVALCYLKEKDLKKAKDRFQAAVQHDPQTDLAGFARRYEDLVEKRIFLERPVRFTLGLFGQYDTNVVLKPTDASLAPEITDEESSAATTTVRIDYVPIIEGPWLFNAQYSFYGNFHDKYSTTHDVISNGIYIAPGYNFGEYALNLAVRYNHTLVRGTSYKRYVDSLSAGPLLRTLAGKNSILELYAGFDKKEYFRPPLTPEEDRDSDTLSTYISWIWLFKEGAFFNLKYEFSDVDTDGAWWDNKGHGFSVNTSIPLIEKLKFQVSGQMLLQDYKNNHLLLDNKDKREDEIYQGSLGFTWEFFENANLVLQYTKTRTDSNIGNYDYSREVYTAGVEYKL